MTYRRRDHVLVGKVCDHHFGSYPSILQRAQSLALIAVYRLGVERRGIHFHAYLEFNCKAVLGRLHKQEFLALWYG